MKKIMWQVACAGSMIVVILNLLAGIDPSQSLQFMLLCLILVEVSDDP